MNEGLLSGWRKSEGDTVSQGEIILDVATDKLTFEVECPEDGVLLKIVVPEGQSVPVGENLGIIGTAGEDISSMLSGSPSDASAEENRVEEIAEPPEKSVPSEVKAPVVEKPSGPVKASPLAKKWASIFGLDLASIVPTGPEGRIVKEDVIKAASIFRASPLAKKIARENGLDITLVPGTGPEGRTTKQDVIRFMEEEKNRLPKSSPVASKMAKDLGVDLASIDADGRIMKEDVMKAAGMEAVEEEAVKPAAPVPETVSGEKRVPLTPMRKVIAERMSQSASTIPSVVFNMEVDFSQFMDFRNRIKKEVSEKGAKVSFNDLLMKVCAKALMDHPMANASYDEGAAEYVMHDYVNIGLAVAVEGGLLVPNVKNVQSKNIFEIASDTDTLVEKARNNRLSMDDMQGGTFTISNLGMFGMHNFTPIINPPEACILAVNAIVEKPVVIDGAIEIRPISVLGLTADHRILDGADAAKFLARIKELIENPYLLMV
jgi:pyruvate dehydrogenase E2 component (dihydrolipoamide acetyltransferase)